MPTERRQEDTDTQPDLMQTSGLQLSGLQLSGMQIVARGRFWAVYDRRGQLVCVTVYKKGAREVVRRLSLASRKAGRKATKGGMKGRPARRPRRLDGPPLPRGSGSPAAGKF